MMQLIDCRYVALKEFKIKKGTQPENSLLFLVQGEIEVYIEGAWQRFGENTLISFPDHIYFERRILKPIEFYHLRFENPDKEPLPAGRIETPQPMRLCSTLKYLLQLNNQNQQALKNQFLADIFNQLQADRLLQPPKGDRIIARVEDFFQKNLQRPISLGEVAKNVDLSVSGLIYHFKQHAHTTPMRYLTALRLQKAQQLLCETESSIAHIAALCGFENAYYFSNTFKKHFRLSPTAYRRSQRI